MPSDANTEYITIDKWWQKFQMELVFEITHDYRNCMHCRIAYTEYLLGKRIFIRNPIRG